MYDNSPSNTPSFSKTLTHFRPNQSSQPELIRHKPSNSKHSAYTTSKKKLSQIHTDLHSLELKFNHFHQNLNLFMNCDNRSSEFDHNLQQLKPYTDNQDINQTQNDPLFDITSLDPDFVVQMSKNQEQSIFPENQPKTFVLTQHDQPTFFNFPHLTSEQFCSIKKMSHQQKLPQTNNQKYNSAEQNNKFKKSKLNKSSAVRNFPMEYFNNVELLFEIMNRKKNRIKQMHSEGKNKKFRERRTTNGKQNKINKNLQVRLLSEENEYFKESNLDQSKHLIIPFQQQNNFSVFESNRKMSKDTIVRKSSTSKILTMRNNIEPNKNNFISIQKKFLSRNTPNTHNIPEVKTQRNFISKTYQNNQLSSPKLKTFQSRKVLSPKQPIKSNTQTILQENRKTNFWSPQHKQFQRTSMERRNKQYVQRKMETKTADEKSMRKKYIKKDQDDDFQITASPILRKTQVQCVGTRRSPCKNEDKEMKISELDQTGIFTGQQFNFINQTKKKSPQKMIQYKEEDSFLKKINDNHARKYRYCCCCLERGFQNQNEDLSPFPSKEQNNKKNTKRLNTIQERSLQRPYCQQNGCCVYQRSASNIGKIYDRSLEKAKVLADQKSKQNNLVTEQSQNLLKKTVSFKSHKTTHNIISSNVQTNKITSFQLNTKSSHDIQDHGYRSKSIPNLITVDNKEEQTDQYKKNDPNYESQKALQQNSHQTQTIKETTFTKNKAYATQENDQLITENDLFEEKTQRKSTKQIQKIQVENKQIYSQQCPSQIIKIRSESKSALRNKQSPKQNFKNKTLNNQNSIKPSVTNKHNKSSHSLSSKKNIKYDKKEGQSQRGKQCRQTFNPSAFINKGKQSQSKNIRFNQQLFVTQDQNINCQKHEKQINLGKSHHSIASKNDKDKRSIQNMTGGKYQKQLQESLSEELNQQNLAQSIEESSDQQYPLKPSIQQSANQQNRISGNQKQVKVNLGKQSGQSLIDGQVQTSDLQQAAKPHQLQVNLSGLSQAQSYLTHLYRNINISHSHLSASSSYPSLLKPFQSNKSLDNQDQNYTENQHINQINREISVSQEFTKSSQIKLTNQDKVTYLNRQTGNNEGVSVFKDQQTVRVDKCANERIKTSQSKQNEEKQHMKGVSLSNGADNYLQQILQLEDMKRTKKWFNLEQTPQSIPSYAENNLSSSKNVQNDREQQKDKFVQINNEKIENQEQIFKKYKTTLNTQIIAQAGLQHSAAIAVQRSSKKQVIRDSLKDKSTKSLGKSKISLKSQKLDCCSNKEKFHKNLSPKRENKVQTNHKQLVKTSYKQLGVTDSNMNKEKGRAGVNESRKKVKFIQNNKETVLDLKKSKNKRQNKELNQLKQPQTVDKNLQRQCCLDKLSASHKHICDHKQTENNEKNNIQGRHQNDEPHKSILKPSQKQLMLYQNNLSSKQLKVQQKNPNYPSIKVVGQSNYNQNSQLNTKPQLQSLIQITLSSNSLEEEKSLKLVQRTECRYGKDNEKTDYADKTPGLIYSRTHTVVIDKIQSDYNIDNYNAEVQNQSHNSQSIKPHNMVQADCDQDKQGLKTNRSQHYESQSLIKHYISQLNHQLLEEQPNHYQHHKQKPSFVNNHLKPQLQPIVSSQPANKHKFTPKVVSITLFESQQQQEQLAYSVQPQQKPTDLNQAHSIHSKKQSNSHPQKITNKSFKIQKLDSADHEIKSTKKSPQSQHQSSDIHGHNLATYKQPTFQHILKNPQNKTSLISIQQSLPITQKNDFASGKISNTQQAFTQIQQNQQINMKSDGQQFYKPDHQVLLSQTQKSHKPNFKLNSKRCLNFKYDPSSGQMPSNKKADRSNKLLESEIQLSQKNEAKLLKKGSQMGDNQPQITQKSSRLLRMTKNRLKSTKKSMDCRNQSLSQSQEQNYEDSHQKDVKRFKKNQCKQCIRTQKQQGHQFCHGCQKQWNSMSNFLNPFINPLSTMSHLNPFLNPYMTPMNFYNPFNKKNMSKSKKSKHQSRDFSDDESSDQEESYQDKKRKHKKKRTHKRNSKEQLKGMDKNYRQLSEESRIQCFSTDQSQDQNNDNKIKTKNKYHQYHAKQNFNLNHSSEEEGLTTKIKHYRITQSEHSKKADIVNLIVNQQPKPILNLELKENPDQLKFYKQFKMAIKLLNFIDPHHNFIKRITEIQQKQQLALWLFPNQLEFKPSSSFQMISVKGINKVSQLKTREICDYINLGLHKLMDQFPFHQNNMVKQLLQMITGSTLFSIKPTSFNKLKNLHKHSNIKGFTFSVLKQELYEIIGSEELPQKKSNETTKIVILKKGRLNSKIQTVQDNLKMTNEQKKKEDDVINVKWEDFMINFTNSLIGVFGLDYQVRALHFISPQMNKKVKNEEEKQAKAKRSLVFTMQLKSPSHGTNKRQKQHCLINVNLFSSNSQAFSGVKKQKSSQFIANGQQEHQSSKGRMLVYYEKQPNQYKYIGSGDLTFISMRAKEGRYLVILEFSKGTLDNMEEGKVIVNYSGRTIQLKQDKWTNDYASMMSADHTEFIKTDQL